MLPVTLKSATAELAPRPRQREAAIVNTETAADCVVEGGATRRTRRPGPGARRVVHHTVRVAGAAAVASVVAVVLLVAGLWMDRPSAASPFSPSTASFGFPYRWVTQEVRDDSPGPYPQRLSVQKPQEYLTHVDGHSAGRDYLVWLLVTAVVTVVVDLVRRGSRRRRRAAYRRMKAPAGSTAG